MSGTVRFDASLLRRDEPSVLWSDAVRRTARLLVDAGYAGAGYPDRLVQVIEKYGPYMVIAPGVALVHAQPRRDAFSDALAAITYPGGITFGHVHNDPVRLVLALTTTTSVGHLDTIAGIARALETDPRLVDRAVAAESDDALVEVLRAALPQLEA